MFHEKFHGIAGGIAYEALIDAEARTHVHGGIFVVMKWADTHEILALFAQ